MNELLHLHKVTGSSKNGSSINTLIYKENTNEHFKTGSLNNVTVDNNSLKVNPYLGDNSVIYFSGEDNINRGSYGGTLSNTPFFEEVAEAGGKCFDFDQGDISFNDSRLNALMKGKEFTIDFWIRPKASKSTYETPICISTGSGVDTSHRAFWSHYRSSGVSFHHSGAQINAPNRVDNKWIHVAIVKVGNEMYAYNNGVQVGSKLGIASLNVTSSQITLGNLAPGVSTDKFHGNMKHFRISDKARWKTPFTPPPLNLKDVEGYRISPPIQLPKEEYIKSTCIDWEGEGSVSVGSVSDNHENDPTALLLNFEDYTDSSPHNREIITNNKCDLVQGRFEKGLKLTDNSWINMKLDIDWNKDFTIDWWESFTQTPKPNTSIFTTRDGNSNTIISGGICLGHNSTELWVGSKDGEWNGIGGTVIKDVTLNVWVHWALVKRGSTFTSYKNGVLFQSITYTGSIYSNPKELCTIGNWCTNTGLGAIIDDFRISNKALWTNDFLPPTKPPVHIEFTPISKGGTIPLTCDDTPIYLKEEVKGETTISNVNLKVQYRKTQEDMKPIDGFTSDEKEKDRIYIFREGDNSQVCQGTSTSGNNLKYASYFRGIELEGTSTSYDMNNGVSTIRPIDLTPYSRLYLEYSTLINDITGTEVGIGVTDSTNIQINPSIALQDVFNADTILCMDISNYNSYKYVNVKVKVGASNKNFKVLITKIWLEK